jgi:uridine kinase
VPVSSPARDALLASVAREIVELSGPGAVRVAVDGVDGAGKSVFADELARVVTAMARPVIRAGVDGFHRPREIRYRRGRTSAQGYFHDSYDYAALRAVLLGPLSSGGSGRYRRVVFDHVGDRPVAAEWEQAAAGSVLLFDGIFLHRPELAGYWDYSILLHASFQTTFARMSTRDGFDRDPFAASNRRYVDGQRLYLAACRPAEKAGVVIDNDDPLDPRILAARNGC